MDHDFVDVNGEGYAVKNRNKYNFSTNQTKQVTGEQLRNFGLQSLIFSHIGDSLVAILSPDLHV